MDVVLEVFDTFLFDRIYAKILPSSLYSSLPLALKNDGHNTTNTMFPSQRPEYIYKPSTQYFQLEPSQYAHMSALPRDNLWRQGITLYLITW
jgi:lathosterol oxidase